MEDVATAKAVFEKLWARATLYGDLVQIFNSSDRVHLSNMAGVIESVLAKVAALQCRDPTAKAHLAFFGVSHRRYLSWLKELMHHLDRMRDTPEDLHMVAFFLELLDFYPSWVQIAVAGAAQNLRGKGMLACAGFAWEDLALTSKLLRKSVSIFPSTARREVELCEAVAALGLELPSSSEERITVIGRGGRATTPDDDLAARLVSTALQEMGQEEYDSIF